MFAVLLLFVSLYMIASAKDDEAREKRQYKADERRHQETLEVLKKTRRKPCTTRKVTRTVAKDRYGQCVAQEVIEYYGELCFDDNNNVYYDYED